MKKNRESYIVIGIGVSMISAFCFWFLQPGLDEVSTLRDSALIVQNHVASGASLAADLSQTKRDVERETEYLAQYHRRITPSARLGPFIEEVSAVAARLGLRNQTIAPMSAKSHGSIMTLPIRVSFESAFDKSFDFVRSVENLDRAVRVIDLVLERVDPEDPPIEGGETVLKTKLTMQVFYEAA